MIDWLTTRHHVDYRVQNGRVMSITADGEIEWQSEKALHLEGSYSANVRVRNHWDGSIEISGNPAKWFQGHNLFGSDDLGGLSVAFARSVFERLGYQMTGQELENLREGLFHLAAIHLTDSWDFGTLPRALMAVRGLADSSRLKHRGQGSMTQEGTTYWRKNSRRLSAKAYAKGHEIKAHQLVEGLTERDRLVDLAQGLVRFEWVLRSMFLKDRRLEIVRNWTRLGVTPQSLRSELLEQLNISDSAMVDTKLLEGLPPRLQAIYTAWMDGNDVRAMFKCRRTFYRYRAQLLPFGIDIAIKRPKASDNVIPLRVVLTGKPLEVPAWARGTPLYFEPLAA